MTDLEATRLCAEAFGFEPYAVHQYESWALESPTAVPCKLGSWAGQCIAYDPLADDAQAMALVKKLHLHIDQRPGKQISVQDPHFVHIITSNAHDLNWCIVQCVVAMQRATTSKGADT